MEAGSRRISYDGDVPDKRRPVLRRHLGLTTVPGEGVFLLCEHGSAVVEDAATSRLLPLLDGSRTGAELVAALDGVLTASEIEAALRALGAAQLVVADAPAGPDRDAGFWESTGLTAPATTAVLLHTVGAVDRDEAARGLRDAGLQVVPDRAALHVVLAEHYLHPELRTLADELAAAAAPWLLAKPVGIKVAVGPVIAPGGPCLRCLGHAVGGRMPSRRYLTDRLGQPPRMPVVDIAATRALALGMVATTALQWLAGRRDDAEAVHTLDTASWRSARHPVRRRPQCPGCGDPGIVAQRMSEPVRTQTRPSSPHRDGGRRAATAADLLERYGHLVDPLTGVVGALTPVAAALPFLHVYSAGPNPALRIQSLRDLRGGLRAHSCGKGDTDEQARASALGEALERASGIFAGDEPVVRTSLHALGDAGVHPGRCQLYSEEQFAGRAAWNAREMTFQHVCDPFDRHAEMDWTPVWSLTAECTRYLPTSLLFYGHREPGPLYAWADSNGCAAGTSLEDALLQGLFELVERDAVAIWWYNRLRRPAVDLDALADPAVQRRRAGHAALGRELWAIDVTSDLGTPTIVAVSRRTGGGREDVVFGFGANSDGRIAAGRALSEVDQFLPAVVGARDDGSGYLSDDPAQLRWWRQERLADHPYLLPDPAREPVRYPPAADGPVDLGAEFDRQRAVLEAAGLEVLALDTTRPDIGLPVVRVIVPGLRHFWARFAPGRLFDVPVRTGQLARPHLPAELNPIPIFV